MKRATVLILILSLAALPLFASEQKMRCASLEHVQGGWMMTIECTGGAGTISLSDDGGYRGTGMFSTWSQEKLGATYQSLIPSDDARVDSLLLG